MSNHSDYACIREATFEDREAISDLRQQFGWERQSVDVWNWLWKQNPAVVRAGSDLPIGWVIEADHGIVGYVASIPFLYRFEDRILTVAVGSAFVVATPFRRYSLALFEAFMNQRQVDMVMGTTVNHPASRMWRLHKGKPFPSGPFDQVMTWVIDPYKFLKSFFIHPERSPLAKLGTAGGLLARIASVALYEPLRIEIALRRRTPRQPKDTLSLTLIDPGHIGPEFDDLWSRKLREGKGEFMALRTSEALQWRFGRPGIRPHAKVLCCRESDRLVGYAIVAEQQVGTISLNRLQIVDMLVQSNDRSVIHGLLFAAYEYGRKRDVAVLDSIGFPKEVRNGLLRAKPYVRPVPGSSRYFKTALSADQTKLEAEDAWYVTLMDGDSHL